MSVFTGHTCNATGYSGSRPKEERQADCPACRRLAALRQQESPAVPALLRDESTPDRQEPVGCECATREAWVALIRQAPAGATGTAFMQRCRWCSARKTQKDKALKHDSDCPVTAAIAALSTPCPKASPCQECAEAIAAANRCDEQATEFHERMKSAESERDSLRERVAAQGELLERFVEFVKSIAGGPPPCSGRGVQQDDDGRRFTATEQEVVDRAHRRYCRRCRAQDLLAATQGTAHAPDGAGASETKEEAL